MKISHRWIIALALLPMVGAAQSNFVVRLATSCTLPFSNSSNANWHGVGTTQTMTSATFASTNGYDFNGTTSFGNSADYLATARLAMSNASAVAVSIWIRPDALDTDDTPFSMANSNAGVESAVFRVHLTNANGSVRFGGRSQDADSFQSISLPSGALTNAAWGHFVLQWSFSGNYGLIYHNGALRASNAVTFGSSGWRLATNGWLATGANPGGTFSSFFDGKIDEVRIFTNILSSAEVSTLWTNGRSEEGPCISSETIPAAFSIRFQ